MWLITQADSRHIPLADESIHCVVTSPPYWGLRDYKLKPQVWGGRENCEHTFRTEELRVEVGAGNWTQAENGPGLASGRPQTRFKGDTKAARLNTEWATTKRGFCGKCGAWLGVLGLEPTPDVYIHHIVECFREVRRVLRSDGTCWLNMGDCYYGGNKGNSGPLRLGDKQAPNNGSLDTRRRDNGTLSPARQGLADGLKPLDLCMIPARVALALQADGWYLRSIIVWAKPNPMPESINGWRWERHRVKIKLGQVKSGGLERGATFETGRSMTDMNLLGLYAQYVDCPGCPKCEENEGLILRKGSWRPTTAHEYIFLLTKSVDYFCDAEAVRETSQANDHSRERALYGRYDVGDGSAKRNIRTGKPDYLQAIENDYGGGFRNLRSVWEIPTQPFKNAHFATFPEEIPLRCIKAGTPEKGVCAKCGAPWARIVDRQPFDATGAYGSNAPGKNSRMFVDQDPVHDRPKSRKKPAGWQEGSGAHDRIPAGRYGGKWIDSGDEQASSYRLNQHERFYREQGGEHDNPFPSPHTIGWKPSCKCSTEERRPAVVLDLFSGSGTVPLVGDKLGRIGIGLDLKWDYCQMAYRRCYESVPLLSK